MRAKARGRNPITSILGVLGAVVLIGAWFFYRIGQGDLTYSYYAAQKDALADLAVRQEAFFEADHDGGGQPDSVYAEVLTRLPAFAPNADVQVTLLYGGRTGWAASTSHSKRAGEGCAVFVGAVPQRPTTPGGRLAEQPDVFYCDM